MAKQPDITVPWKFVVLCYKHQILLAAVKSGKTPHEAARIYDRLLNEEPDEEMIALVEGLVNEYRKTL